MSLSITYQPIRVLIDGHDSEGRLILADGQLAAVIVRLDGDAHYPEDKGRWHLEAGFGRCDARSAPSTFANPEEAGAWVEHTIQHWSSGHHPHRSALAVEYRRRAEELRTIARQISISDARSQLLGTAAHLDVLADEEEHGTQAIPPIPPALGRED